MVNIGVFSWDLTTEYNEDLDTKNKSLIKIYNHFDEPGGDVIVREIITSLYSTDDILTISNTKEGVIVSYKDYNNFDWDFPKQEYLNNGLTDTLLENTNIDIIKLAMGKLLITNINFTNTILTNLNDFKEMMFEMPTILSEVIYNIYNYEYINLPDIMNINKYYKDKFKEFNTLNVDYMDLLDNLRDNIDDLEKVKVEYLSILPTLKSMDFYW